MRPLSLFSRVLRRATTARPEEIGFAVRAWMLAPMVEVCLASAGLPRTLRLVRHAERWGRARRQSAAPRLDVGAGAIWTARAFALLPLRGLCLARSVVQHTLHALDGTPSRLVVGVRRGAANHVLDAHAWVSAPGDSGNESEGFHPIFVGDPFSVEGRI